MNFIPYEDHVITQVATGLFGVREETIRAHGSSSSNMPRGPSPAWAAICWATRSPPAWRPCARRWWAMPCFRPSPSTASIRWRTTKSTWTGSRHINPQALVSVKVSTPTDVDMVAVGSYYAGAHIVHIDGSYGGTGAAPDIAKKNIAMPIEYAIPKVHRFLAEEGVRDKITPDCQRRHPQRHGHGQGHRPGRRRRACIGTAELVALECVRCGNCESGRGCARGIASTDDELRTHDHRRLGRNSGSSTCICAWRRQLMPRF